MSPREFAIDVVRQLQRAGHSALWAGGCVRDQLMGRNPKDYDVATSAKPDQVRELFGRRRTLPIGASFGVITVLGPKSAGAIEVATFRCDGDYSDGRHPDSVRFTDAREDALRRDFTINGIFFDPLAQQVIDYVDGQTDLQRGIIRAIGNPRDRFEEDKLRMLRAIRFATTFDFQIENDTEKALRLLAGQIRLISAERIGAELIRLLCHVNRAKGCQLLADSGLIEFLLPPGWFQASEWHGDSQVKRVDYLKELKIEQFEPAVYLMLKSIWDRIKMVPGTLNELQAVWRLTNQQRMTLSWIGQHWQRLVRADQTPWCQIQPLLIHADAKAGLAVAEVLATQRSGIEFCLERLAWPPQQLDPPWLIDGNQLIQNGLTPGPEFKQILNHIRDKQLMGEFNHRDQVISWLRQNGTFGN